MGEIVTLVNEIRGIPLWLIQEYLVELGGEVVQPGEVEGLGWKVKLKKIEPYQIGSLIIGQVEYRIQADAEVLAVLSPALEKKMLRAGG